MSFITENTLFTTKGLKEKSPITQRNLITKVTEAMERVELCKHCYPKLGDEMTLFFEDTTIKINLKLNKIWLVENLTILNPLL